MRRCGVQPDRWRVVVPPSFADAVSPATTRAPGAPLLATMAAMFFPPSPDLSRAVLFRKEASRFCGSSFGPGHIHAAQSVQAAVADGSGPTRE